MKVWMVCEAFTLTGDAFGHETVHQSLAPWSIACADRKTAMRELENAILARVVENYEGCDDAEAEIREDIRYIRNSRDKLGRGIWRYRYSADDREVVWKVYPCEVKGE